MDNFDRDPNKVSNDPCSGKIIERIPSDNPCGEQIDEDPTKLSNDPCSVKI